MKVRIFVLSVLISIGILSPFFIDTSCEPTEKVYGKVLTTGWKPFVKQYVKQVATYEYWVDGERYVGDYTSKNALSKILREGDSIAVLHCVDDPNESEVFSILHLKPKEDTTVTSISIKLPPNSVLDSTRGVRFLPLESINAIITVKSPWGCVHTFSFGQDSSVGINVIKVNGQNWRPIAKYDTTFTPSFSDSIYTEIEKLKRHSIITSDVPIDGYQISVISKGKLVFKGGLQLEEVRPLFKLISGFDFPCNEY